MNSHMNASTRTTFDGRKLSVSRIAVMGRMPTAEAAAVSVRTARKWRDRLGQYSLQALLDRTPRPAETRSRWTQDWEHASNGFV